MDIKRYLIQKTPIGTMMKEHPEGSWVEAQDFYRILVERDALQRLLGERDEEVGRLRSLLVASKEHVEFSVEYWANNEKSDWELVESIRALENQA